MSRIILSKNTPLMLALLALLVCVFLPPRIMPKSTYNFMVTFDISQSMNVGDVLVDGAPLSRLAMAKRSAQLLLQSLPCGSQIGWSIFTQRRVLPLLQPLEVCEHYAGLLASLDLVDGRMRWANASGIGRGLHQSIRSANDIDGTITVLFMTDGHEAPPLRPGRPAMPNTSEYEVDGLIVGIGGEVPARIPKLDTDGKVVGYWQADEVVQDWNQSSGQGNQELSSRQDRHLQELSRLSGLGYLPLHSAGLLVDAALKPRFAALTQARVDLRWIPASFSLLLLSWRFMPRRRA